MHPRKKQIIDTAARLFRQRGYSAVTMRDLADAMGMKAASLYNHISSKQEILTHLVIGTAEQFTQAMRHIRVQQVSAPEKIKKIIQHHIDLTLENPGAMAALNTDWMHLEEQLPYFLEMRNNYESHFRNILLEGMQAGEIHSYNPEIILFSLLSTLRNLYLWYSKKDHIEVGVLRSELPDILLEGLVV